MKFLYEKKNEIKLRKLTERYSALQGKKNAGA